MRKYKTKIHGICLLALLFSAYNKAVAKQRVKSPRAYYVSASGIDSQSGDINHPWQTIAKINSTPLQAGDSVLLHGGDTYNGTLLIDENKSGRAGMPVTISSYGHGKAIINAANNKGIEIKSSRFIAINNIKILGAGRKDGNTTNGLSVLYSNNIIVDTLEVSGFQKAGLRIHSSSNIKLHKVYAHSNGAAGIVVAGDSSKKECRNIFIDHCIAENNPGDPTNFTNHSGNGIVVSQCTDLKIAYCVATNNGWDMPRIGNGPVGIWAWEADSVTIEHCISYRNKTSNGGEDGGGFDFDGGVTNSTIQYCLSYENDGSGIGLFQYNGASPWYNNTIRYNVSINDGLVSAAKAGIYIWNADYTNKLSNSLIYNNTIYNSQFSAIHYAKESDNEGLRFYNNILLGKDAIIIGEKQTGEFIGNNYWSIDKGFDIAGFQTLGAWASAKKQEQLKDKMMGLNINPLFVKAGNISITNPDLLPVFFNCKLPKKSFLKNSGLNLQKLFSIENGGKDFNGNKALGNGIGASF